MIRNDEGLRQTQAALADLERGLAALRQRRQSMHPTWYDVSADPYIEHILRMRAEIDAYLGIPAGRKPDTDAAGNDTSCGPDVELSAQEPGVARS
jgi:hypothetical protein